MSEISPQVEARFWAKVDKRGAEECWPWAGTIDPKGYGRISINNRSRSATHISLEIADKPRPDDKPFALHRCDNPPCVNPAHLWWGTAGDNAKDAFEKGRNTRRADPDYSPGIRTLPAWAGENNKRARLTAEDAAEIRLLRGKVRQRELAERFGVSETTICGIHTGKRWNTALAIREGKING